MNRSLLCLWPVGRGSWWIQCREPKISAYLRDLKSVRRVGFAVTGEHLTIWAFDGTKQKLRAIVRGLDRQLETLSASHGNQLEPIRAIFLP